MIDIDVITGQTCVCTSSKTWLPPKESLPRAPSPSPWRFCTRRGLVPRCGLKAAPVRSAPGPAPRAAPDGTWARPETGSDEARPSGSRFVTSCGPVRRRKRWRRTARAKSSSGDRMRRRHTPPGGLLRGEGGANSLRRSRSSTLEEGNGPLGSPCTRCFLRFSMAKRPRRRAQRPETSPCGSSAACSGTPGRPLSPHVADLGSRRARTSSARSPSSFIQATLRPFLRANRTEEQWCGVVQARQVGLRTSTHGLSAVWRPSKSSSCHAPRCYAAPPSPARPR